MRLAGYFPKRLRAVDRWPGRGCEAYQCRWRPDMRRRLRHWAAEILDERLDEGGPSLLR